MYAWALKPLFFLFPFLWHWKIASCLNMQKILSSKCLCIAVSCKQHSWSICCPWRGPLCHRVLHRECPSTCHRGDWLNALDACCTFFWSRENYRRCTMRIIKCMPELSSFSKISLIWADFCTATEQKVLERNLGHDKTLKVRPVADLSGSEMHPSPAGSFGTKSPFKGEICTEKKTISITACYPSLNGITPCSDRRVKQEFEIGYAIWHRVLFCWFVF